MVKEIPLMKKPNKRLIVLIIGILTAVMLTVFAFTGFPSEAFSSVTDHSFIESVISGIKNPGGPGLK